MVRFWNAPGKTFSEAFDPRNNAIGFLRTFLALLVILTHSFHLGGLGVDWVLRFGQDQETIGGIAVKGFFVLSGFLITASYVRSPSVWRYMWQRFLRIMPGFWVALLVVALGFAPLMYRLQNGTLDGFTLLNEGGSVDYIRSNFFLEIKQYEVAGLTARLPWPNAFNGSLWTLIYEAKAYLMVAVIGVFGLFKGRRSIVLAGTAILYILHLIGTASQASLATLSPLFADKQLLILILFFMFGSVWYLYQDKIVVQHKLGILAIFLYILGLRYSAHAILSPFTFTYMIMYLASHLPFKNFDRKADFSYGIYIYAFPIQQLMSQLQMNKRGIVVYSLLSVMATIPLAVASYYFVEKPSLRLKSLSFSKKGLVI